MTPKRHLKLATDADAPDPVTPPAVLQGASLEEWNRVAPELERTGMLTMRGRSALAAYCQAYQRWTEAESKIRETGEVVKSPSGAPMLNPYLSVSNKAQDQMRSFMREFGMTPSAEKQVTPKQKRVAEDLDRLFGA